MEAPSLVPDRIIEAYANGKNKLFFFGSFLQLTTRAPPTFLATVPTVLERQGELQCGCTD